MFLAFMCHNLPEVDDDELLWRLIEPYDDTDEGPDWSPDLQDLLALPYPRCNCYTTAKAALTDIRKFVDGRAAGRSCAVASFCIMPAVGNDRDEWHVTGGKKIVADDEFPVLDRGVIVWNPVEIYG